MASSSQDKVYKVLMVGRAAVGKTCILRRYCLEYFSDQVVPTLGCDFVLKTVPNGTGEGPDVKLQIWDIAGQDYAPHVSHVFFRGAYAAVVACDITSDRSYEVAAQWKRDIDSKVFFPGTPKNIPCILMLNKKDLGDSHMSDDELNDFCKTHGFAAWFKVSAKTGEGLEGAFSHLLGEVRRMDREKANAPQPQAIKPQPQAQQQRQTVDVSRAAAKDKKGDDKKCPC